MHPSCCSVLEDEGDLHVDAVVGHLAIADVDLHLVDPGALDLVEGLVGTFDTPLDGIPKLVFDEALISVTFATDMTFSFAIAGRASTLFPIDGLDTSRPSR
jgi:hypothetical protein